MDNKEEKLSKEELAIVNSPEWKAGQDFLERCHVTDDDERFLRFYDFIAGWNKCKEQKQAEFIKLIEGEIAKEKAAPIRASNIIKHNLLIDLLSKAKAL